ncbi:MAG: hypothetical protein FWF41_04000 [Betaproteobacteria bacterium]|nr:hypothetical protein [Betaproteobacteria bacterium]
MFAKKQGDSFSMDVFRVLCVLFFTVCSSFFAINALAAIPAAERQALIDLYNSTNGDNWYRSNANWKTGDDFSAAGTECNWYGVTCDTGKKHVTEIRFYDNRLVGALPSTLNALTALQVFSITYESQLTGSIPDLVGLTELYLFDVSNNQLTGNIPDLTGLAALQSFSVNNNRLTGSIPDLSKLASLGLFDVSNNQFTGNIPSLAGLTVLYGFKAGNNQLTGSIPPLDGMKELHQFDVSNNQLIGPILSLAGAKNLRDFIVSDNQLTGSIPDLSELTSLRLFYVSNNQLTGTPPAPAAGSLEPWWCFAGDPTCPSPSLPNAMLCPNGLSSSADPAINAAWDTITGHSPWYAACTAAPIPVPTHVYTNQWIKTDSEGKNDEDAWGLSILQNFASNSRYIFVPWFTYDSNGKAAWYIFQGDNWWADDKITAEVRRYSGPDWGMMPYDNSKARFDVVGTATLTFTSATTATFSYNVDNVARTINLAPIDNMSMLSDAYTGQWYSPDEDNWGLTVLRGFQSNPNTVFVPWYSYDSNGKASWYIFQSDLIGNTVSADVYRYTGPSWGTMPYDNGKVGKTKVGTAKLTFTSATKAVFEYDVEGMKRTVNLIKIE